MSPTETKRTMRTEIIIAAALIGTGLAMIAGSLAHLPAPTLMAQATPPLQSTPGAESKPSAPPAPSATGTRPADTPPQPARPEPEAQNSGARPALPPAPPEKVGEPIPAR